MRGWGELIHQPLSGDNGKYMNSVFIYDEIFVSSVLGKLNYHIPINQSSGETAHTVRQT